MDRIYGLMEDLRRIGAEDYVRNVELIERFRQREADSL